MSLDGSLTGFQPDMGVHYQIAGSYKAQANLIGSNTVKSGVELFGQGNVSEEKSDFEKPERDGKLPYWVLIDSGAVLKGLLHICRRFEYCRDVVLLVSESTSKDYLTYLKERNYDYYVVGKEHVDLRNTLELLSDKLKAKKVLVDSGRILGNLLVEQGLVDELSLLVHPVIVGEKAYSIFGNIKQAPILKLKKQEQLENGLVWLVYKVNNC
jgi:2,5-diamino-6-(ribosylamino)-4(3H)-pyrimidinone 5'-phosphate reductase